MLRCIHGSATGRLSSLAFLLVAVLAVGLAPSLGLADAIEDEGDMELPAEEDQGPPAEHTTSAEWRESEAELWGRKGPYVGAGGLAMFSNSGHLHNGVNLDDDVGRGFNVRLGLRTASWMALEVMYEQVSNFDVSRGAKEDTGTGWFWSLNGKGYLMSDKRLQVYGLVGLGAMSIQPDIISRRTGFGMRFGAGLDYHITRSIVANLEGGYALGIGTQVENYGYGVLGAGVAYRF